MTRQNNEASDHTVEQLNNAQHGSREDKQAPEHALCAHTALHARAQARNSREKTREESREEPTHRSTPSAGTHTPRSMHVRNIANNRPWECRSRYTQQIVDETALQITTATNDQSTNLNKAMAGCAPLPRLPGCTSGEESAETPKKSRHGRPGSAGCTSCDDVTFLECRGTRSRSWTTTPRRPRGPRTTSRPPRDGAVAPVLLSRGLPIRGGDVGDVCCAGARGPPRRTSTRRPSS